MRNLELGDIFILWDEKKEQHSNEFKKKVALEALKEESTLVELAIKHDVHINNIRLWKEILENNSTSLFDRPNKKSPLQVKIENQQKTIDQLYGKVGKLTIKNERLKTGETPLALGNYGIDFASGNWLWGENSSIDEDGLFFLGDTRIDYRITTGSKFCIVDFIAFDQEGFWDIKFIGRKKDRSGPNRERKGSTPYPFIPKSWSISFNRPKKINWPVGGNES